eukprot:7375810-Prymnesium_polylepis.2
MADHRAPAAVQRCALPHAARAHVQGMGRTPHAARRVRVQRVGRTPHVGAPHHGMQRRRATIPHRGPHV